MPGLALDCTNQLNTHNMSIITLFLVLSVVITLLLLVNERPLTLTLRRVITFSIAILLLLWFLERFGVWGPAAGVTVN